MPVRSAVQDPTRSTKGIAAVLKAQEGLLRRCEAVCQFPLSGFLSPVSEPWSLAT
jgi:hypothetical protein